MEKLESNFQQDPCLDSSIDSHSSNFHRLSSTLHSHHRPRVGEKGDEDAYTDRASFKKEKNGGK